MGDIDLVNIIPCYVHIHYSCEVCTTTVTVEQLLCQHIHQKKGIFLILSCFELEILCSIGGFFVSITFYIDHINVL